MPDEQRTANNSQTYSWTQTRSRTKPLNRRTVRRPSSDFNSTIRSITQGTWWWCFQALKYIFTG